MRLQIDQLRKKSDPIAVLLGSRADDKVLLIAAVSKGVQAKGLDAVAWVKHAAKVCEGGGGGRPDLAQAGGKLPGKLPEAIAAGKAFMEEKLK
jgi:alanyl-tRNA synthetase